MVSIARLSVVKQSSFGLPGQYGGRVTRVNVCLQYDESRNQVNCCSRDTFKSLDTLPVQFRLLFHRYLICGDLTISSEIAGDSLSSSNNLLNFLQCAQEVFIFSNVAFAMVVSPGFLSWHFFARFLGLVPSGSCSPNISAVCPSSSQSYPFGGQARFARSVVSAYYR